jgi:hypothetical protein
MRASSSIRILVAAPRPRFNAELGLAALSMGGVAWVVLQFVVAQRMGMFPIPAGHSILWDLAGDRLRAGQPIYVPTDDDPFFYAPPIVLLFAALSWLPPAALTLLTVIGSVIALRLIGGSWRGAGIACWFPYMPFALADGNFNLLVAASIVLAARGRPSLATVMSLFKISPVLAVDRRQWKVVLAILATSLVVTLPWWHLWIDWAAFLTWAFDRTFAPEVPIPFLARLAVAVPLVLSGSPTARALGAAIALPAFYWGSIVVLVAPVAVLIRGLVDQRRNSPEQAATA